MTLPVDPLTVLLDHLRADSEIATRTAGRIYGGDRPHGPDGDQPAAPLGAALSARLAGGRPHPDLPLADVEIDLRCWGGVGPDGPQRAVAIWRALHAAVNTGGLNVNGAHLLWALEAQGPTLLRDPDTNEAFVRATLRVATADATLGP